MHMKVRDAMQTDVQSVEPEMSLPELERAFLTARVSSFPVLESGRLVGIVSRSDIVRQLCVERSVAEMASDFYRDDVALHEDPIETLAEIAARIGARIEDMRVRDVMIREVQRISPDISLRSAAQQLTERRIHRLPVTEEDRLVGIISAMDIVRLLAEGRLTET